MPARALLLAVLAACGSKGDAEPTDKAAAPAPAKAPPESPVDVVGMTRAVVDDMCACADRACVDALEPRWDAARVLFGSVKDPEGAALIDSLARRFSACVINVVTATQPPP